MLIYDWKSYIVLASLCVNFLSVLILFRFAFHKKSGKAYFFALISIILWTTSLLLFRSHFLGETILWERILYITASFTSTTFLYFTLVYPDDQTPSRNIKAILLIENLLIALLVMHPSWIVVGINQVWGKEDVILLGPLFIFYALHITLPLLVGFAVLIKKYFGIPRFKTQISVVLSGYVLASSAAMLTNLILPWLGYSELNWSGPVFSSIIGLTTTYAIVRHKLFDVRFFITESLVLVLNIFLSVQLVASESVEKFVVNFVLLVSAITVSYFLIERQAKDILSSAELARVAALEESNRKLKELDKQKDDFFTIAAHQLRTPVSVIKNYIAMLADGDFGKMPSEAQEVFKNIELNTDWLVRLGDNLMQITKLEQGTVEFKIDSFDFVAVIEEALTKILPKAHLANTRIEWNKPVSSYRVVGDYDKCVTALTNILDNAVRYGNGQPVSIVLEQKNPKIVVKVIDQGIGFDSDDKERFFTKFQRGNNVQGLDVNTTSGIGLYITKRFIEGQNGELLVESEGLGKGSMFGFWLPSSVTQ